MVFYKNQKTEQQSIQFKRSMLAMCIMALTAPAFAQDQTTNDSAETGEEVEELVVTGMRQALGSAQEIKRQSATIVESITAEDMGSFPDKSVAEALQRVAGITVNRFAASSDTAHFSTEPSGVLVRGLDQVRTEFNGRDSFSANASRGLSWGDVSPELMSGVDTYKNQMAELIEGGIAGTVNMRTRVPFDQSGEMKALSVSTNYGDLSKEFTPEVSGLYSNRWETAAGEFGFLANLAYSQVQTRSEGIQEYRMNRFRDIYAEDTLYYIPAAVSVRDNLYDRERQGVALAAQWQDTDEVFVATLQFNRSEYENAWEEYLVNVLPADFSYGQSVLYEIKPNSDGSLPATYPRPLNSDEPFVFGQNGLFQSGLMTSDIGWWGNGDGSEAGGYGMNAAGQPMVPACYGWNGCGSGKRGVDMATATRSNNNQNMTQDFGFNLKWTPTDTVRANFDLQYVDSTVENYDIEVGYNSFANLDLDLSGEHPEIALSAPEGVNSSPGLFSNPNNYYIHHIMDHVEDSEGNELAFKTDFEIDIDSGWVESVKLGARYADRDQQVRWSGYNWQNVSNTWTSNQAGYYNLDRHEPDTIFNTGFQGYPEGHYMTRTLKSDFLNITPNEFVFANMELLQNQELMASTMGAQALGLPGGVGWDPICSNVGDRGSEIAGTCFRPSEVVDVSEETNAFYVQLNFGGDDAELFGKPISGNIGVRYVETELVSRGGAAYPTMTPEQLECETLDAPPNLPPGAQYVPQSVGCYLAADDIAFANGASALSTTTAKHTNILPSFNIKMDLDDEWLVRFALSKAMSRPDIGNMRNYVGVGLDLPDENNFDDPLWIKDSSGEITGAKVFYSGSAQNPYLKPIEANQVDISIERYFADVGSFSFALYYKEFQDYIQFGKFNRDFTNNGVTKTAEIRGPLNGKGAELQGFEISYSRFFDFLPAPYDGFGIQTNYTFIDNAGITNSGVESEESDGSTVTGQAPDTISVARLEGLSDHAANLVLMYEKDDWALRLAYSWRSEFMVTAIDCCVSYPIWNEATGQLDGSIRYNATDNIEISFSASNLLNEETVLQQQVSNVEDGGLRLPNAWFQNDRRYTLGVRFKY